MNKHGALLIWILIIIAALLSVFWFYEQKQIVDSSQNKLVYVDPFGYSFEYPSDYAVLTSDSDLARINHPDLTMPAGGAMEAQWAINADAEAPKADAIIESASTTRDFFAYISNETGPKIEDNGGERSGNRYYSVVDGKLFELRSAADENGNPIEERSHNALTPAFMTDSGLSVYKDEQGYIVALGPNHFVVFNQAYFSDNLVPVIKSLRSH